MIIGLLEELQQQQQVVPQQKQQQQETSIPEGNQVVSFTSSHWRGHLASQVSAIPIEPLTSLPKLNDQGISSSRIQKDEGMYSINLKPSKLTSLGPGAKGNLGKETLQGVASSTPGATFCPSRQAEVAPSLPGVPVVPLPLSLVPPSVETEVGEVDQQKKKPDRRASDQLEGDKEALQEDPSVEDERPLSANITYSPSIEQKRS